MSVRVVARIRPLLKAEIETDVIVQASSNNDSSTTVTIPDPKHVAQKFSFDFSRVFDRNATQQELFDAEISPTIKHLFAGFDVTIFAYGVTGTGKTHTMRGGKTLAERGVIPRLLSSIYRKQRKTDKDSGGHRSVEVSLSYYEIYNDKVFDLLEPVEKRTLAGLAIRDNNGKTIISGLTERPCTTLREFEQLYDEANINRSTSSTKLNAHSSRSHAILQVKVTQILDERTLVSTVSATDLAGSEDNRRTDNNKERLVESSSINKSLFVLAQCVEAISKRQTRIPYRESKMTRILSLGQNSGLTIMILNLAPVRSYHLDTLSSLNFANRTKKIEVNEVENEPVFIGKYLQSKTTATQAGTGINRQPLRPIPFAVNTGVKPFPQATGKPMKSFSVFAEGKDGGRLSNPRSLKRRSDSTQPLSARPSKISRSTVFTANNQSRTPEMSQAKLENLVNRLVDEKLAKQALSEHDQGTAPVLSEDIQRRLDALEQRVEKKEDGRRAEGLQYLLMAKQHIVRGEETSALRMYRLASPFFPNNDKLASKMLALEDRIRRKRDNSDSTAKRPTQDQASPSHSTLKALPLPVSATQRREDDRDSDYTDELQHDTDAYGSDDSFHYKSKTKARKPANAKTKVLQEQSSTDPLRGPPGDVSPRSANLLRIVNTRDLSQIRMLRGVGLKKAEAIVSCLCNMDEAHDRMLITDLQQLGALKGVGSKTVENMRKGISV